MEAHFFFSPGRANILILFGGALPGRGLLKLENDLPRHDTFSRLFRLLHLPSSREKGG